MSKAERSENTSSKDRFAGQTVGVLMGGLSPEREVSLKTGIAVLNALQRKGYQAVAIDTGRDAVRALTDRSPAAAFIALHGSLGEDGTVQGLLEVLGIPYTGSNVLASALAMNKSAAKKIFVYHGLPTPSFQTLRADAESGGCPVESLRLPLPFVVKPAEEGSTIGISIVKEPREIGPALVGAMRYGGEVLIEEYVPGRELTVGIVDGCPLPLVEVRPQSGFYDYRAKYTSGETQYSVAPEIGTAMSEQIQNLAARAFDVLGCSGAARVDFILSKQAGPLILEINTIPGMTETSLLPMAAKHAGIDFETLVARILHGARLHKSAHAPDPEVQEHA